MKYCTRPSQRCPWEVACPIGRDAVRVILGLQSASGGLAPVMSLGHGLIWEQDIYSHQPCSHISRLETPQHLHFLKKPPQSLCMFLDNKSCYRSTYDLNEYFEIKILLS